MQAQPINFDEEMENWHDYTVESRREIVSLLRNIGEKNQLLRMLVRGESDVAVTSILDVEPDEGYMVLDCPISRDQTRRVLAAHSLQFETSLDKIRILFSSDGAEEMEYDGRAALQVAIPATMIRLQRREYYRMATPVTNPVRVHIPIPVELGGGDNTFPLSDISCGGIAILDPKLMLGDTPGMIFKNCRIDLPDGPITTDLEIRSAQEVTLLNGKTNRRLGCQFVDLSRGALAAVQRYITKLERERNARLAGLG
ncbi:flagellar brake protein [Massilia endophytica]|uniref:flagellar brake protein n=1 Tax=Massilia endophytica TaxID=2899220 RepID=UPI001E2910A0|nr:flagellar brake protein [Massilia endophytica]UGQ45208.1 flagellar brake protein [Massilia endophytica]